MKKSLKLMLLTILFTVISTVTIVYANDETPKNYSKSITFDNLSSYNPSKIQKVVLDENGFYDLTIECKKGNQLESCNIYSYSDENASDYYSEKNRLVNKKYENVYFANKNDIFYFAIEPIEDDNFDDTYSITLKYELHDSNSYTTLNDFV